MEGVNIVGVVWTDVFSMHDAVHNDTKCHIHFPDSNRAPYGGERSNQVSITGQADNLEVARRRIRVCGEDQGMWCGWVRSGGG